MTDIYFSFDVEDYTCNFSSDGIRDAANLLHEYGVRGNFNIVGYLARELIRNRRQDVLDALKNHTISFHSLRHSWHPDLMEYTDREDYAAAREQLLREECEGIGMVKAALGIEKPFGACPPGDCVSYVALYAYQDMGIRPYWGSVFNTPDGSNVYFCNGIHTNYDYTLEGLFYDTPDYSPEAFLNSLAGKRRVIIYHHPNMAGHKKFWDMANYFRKNIHGPEDWVEPERYSPEEIDGFYKKFRALVEALQKDNRFVIRDPEYLLKEAEVSEKTRQVTRDRLPVILEKLQENFTCLTSPVNLSLADCFHAARHFLTSSAPFTPGYVKGFLKTPVRLEKAVTVTREEVLKAAENIDEKEFLTPFFTLGDKILGPADMLFAMLRAALGEENILLEPRAELPSLEDFPGLRDVSFRGTWVHSEDLADAYLSDRLRLQSWTLRKEENPAE